MKNRRLAAQKADLQGSIQGRRPLGPAADVLMHQSFRIRGFLKADGFEYPGVIQSGDFGFFEARGLDVGAEVACEQVLVGTADGAPDMQ